MATVKPLPNSKVARHSFVASVADYDIFIEVDGSGPYMIMTNGLGASTDVFQPLAEIFATEYTLVRSTGRGQGIAA